MRFPWKLIWCLAVIGGFGLTARICGGQEPAKSDGLLERAFAAEVSAPTLGGMQFWTDEFVYRDWRIQRNSFTGHCRLLNEQDQRVTFGSYDDCLAKFESIRREKMLPPRGDRVIVLLHGLFGFRDQLDGMSEFLKANTRSDVLNVGYASTQGDIGQHAAALRKIVNNLGDVKEVNFVAHSMGNLVIRHFLHDEARAPTRHDRLVNRIVMVAPPNQGAKFAVHFTERDSLQRLLGGSISELGTAFDRVKDKLDTPACEFGIIAACCTTPHGGNPSLPGDDDLVLSIEETKLPGACDFKIVSGVHPGLCRNREVQKCTLRFLEQGCFESPEKRQPLPAIRSAALEPQP